MPSRASWGKKAVVLIGLAVLGAVLLVPTSASALWRGYQVQNGNSYRCLEAETASWRTDVGYVRTEECTYPKYGLIAWHQVWYAHWNENVSTIRTPGPPVGPSKCLDAWPDPSDPYGWGYKVTVRECNGQDQQRWKLDANPSRAQFENVKFAGMCLDVTLQTIDHDYVGLYPCRRGLRVGDTQLWWRKGFRHAPRGLEP